MIKKFKKLGLLMACAICLSLCTACSTNVGEHSSTYIEQMKYVFETAKNNSIDTVEGSSSELDPDALLAVENLTVDEDGNYSFDATENAEYYYVYIYENNTTKDATAQSEKITEDGSGTYTGSISDIAQLTYGDWKVAVVAYPTSDSGKKASPEAKVTYTRSGEVDYGDPQVYYMWTLSSNTLSIKVDDMDYAMTAYPTNIHLTLTNDADSSDVIELDINDVSESSATATTTDAKEDATYTVKADFTWDENYVSNPSYSVDGAEAVTSSTENTIAGNFYYSSSIFNTFDFPHVQENFDPEKGGSVGYWYNNTTTEESDTNAYFEATPKTAENGAKWSYDIVVTSPSGAITATPKLSPGSATTTHIFGTLDIFEDGTFTMNIEYQYLRTDSMNAAVYYVPDVDCSGIYSTNDDGTINLSYDHENAKETDYDIVQEVTGKAAQYLEEHPDEVLSESPSMGAGMVMGPEETAAAEAEGDEATDAADVQGEEAPADAEGASAEEVPTEESSEEASAEK